MNKYLYVVTLLFVINFIVKFPTNAEESGPIPRVNITFPANNVTTAPPLSYLVFGNSSDKSSGNCEVYLSINNGDPQLVTPLTDGNYSFWSYSSLDNSTLNVGQNNLTANYVCPNDLSSTVNNSTVFTVDPNYSNDIFDITAGLAPPDSLPSTGGGRLESTF